MRRLFRRSMIWFLPVVILPLGALLVLQVRFLRTKSVSAERNWQRNSMEAVALGIEKRYRTGAEAALQLSHVQLLSVGTLGQHFRKQRVPAARTWFVMHFREGRISTRFYDTNGVERKPEDWREGEAVKMASMPWHAAHVWDRVADGALHVDERDRKHRLILRPVLDESMRVAGVAGVVLDEALAKKTLTTLAATLFQQQYPRREMALRVGSDLAVKPSRGRDFISQPLTFVFTDWRVGIRDACASPEELAATQFRHNMMWTGGAFVVLLGAIGLAGGSVARQMRLSQMKSDFVSNVSHELRTPLSSIRVFGEYMRLGRVTKPEKIQEYGQYIEAEGRRLTALINNILDFSRIESEEKKYRFCETDIVELVEQTVAGFEVPLRESGVSLAFQPPAIAPPFLPLDKEAIAQVIVNLLDNAVKYSNGRKEIEVAVSSTPRDVRVSVRDHGIGVPAGERKKIFEKFYRAGSVLVHDVKGSGLGLSIVQHVVRAHGGRVEVESEPGQGSTFTIILPLAAPAAGEARGVIAGNAAPEAGLTKQ